MQLATEQLLEVQVAVPLAAKHTVPQVPQLPRSFEVFTSQPSPGLPLQSARGGVHELMPHTLFTQFAWAPPGVGQTLPQALQLLTLLVVLTSQPLATLPSQLAKPALQLSTQVPAEQVGLALLLPHTLPHDPQFETLLPRLISQPSESKPLQSAHPALQLAMAQVPLSHLAVAWASRHTLPQEPQLLTSDVLFDSQPLVVLASQFA